MNKVENISLFTDKKSQGTVHNQQGPYPQGGHGPPPPGYGPPQAGGAYPPPPNYIPPQPSQQPSAGAKA